MAADPQSASVSALVSAIVLHISNLLKGEFALARIELVEKLQSTRNAVIMVAVAVALVPALVGLIFATLILVMTAFGLPAVWVALAVTCLVALTMLTLVIKARNLMRWGDLSASRTVQGLRRDAETLKEMMSNDTSV